MKMMWMTLLKQWGRRRWRKEASVTGRSCLHIDDDDDEDDEGEMGKGKEESWIH